MPKLKKESKEMRMVNIHQVNGDVNAIEFLKYADFHWVEGLFLHAKQFGKVEFEFHGQMFNLIKNRNLTYTVEEVPEKVVYLESM